MVAGLQKILLKQSTNVPFGTLPSYNR